jgi:hypothetical protein
LLQTLSKLQIKILGTVISVAKVFFSLTNNGIDMMMVSLKATFPVGVGEGNVFPLLPTFKKLITIALQ